MHALGYRPVVQHQHLHPAGLPARMPERRHLRVGRGLVARHPHRPPPGDGQHRPDAVGAVKGGVHPVAPMVPVAVGNPRPDGRAVVDILTLGIGDLADIPVLVPPPHLKGVVHIAVVFRVGVHLARFLHRLDKGHRLGHGLAGQHLAEHVPARPQQPDGIGRVLVGVIGQHHRVHVVLEELLKILVKGDLDVRLLRQLAHLVQQRAVPIAHRHQRGVWVVGQHLYHGFAAESAEYADANFVCHFPNLLDASATIMPAYAVFCNVRNAQICPRLFKQVGHCAKRRSMG